MWVAGPDEEVNRITGVEPENAERKEKRLYIGRAATTGWSLLGYSSVCSLIQVSR